MHPSPWPSPHEVGRGNESPAILSGPSCERKCPRSELSGRMMDFSPAYGRRGNGSHYNGPPATAEPARINGNQTGSDIRASFGFPSPPPDGSPGFDERSAICGLRLLQSGGAKSRGQRSGNQKTQPRMDTDKRRFYRRKRGSEAHYNGPPPTAEPARINGNQTGSDIRASLPRLLQSRGAKPLRLYNRALSIRRVLPIKTARAM